MTGSTVRLGVSTAIREVEDDIALAAQSGAGVLISGEGGVGKGLVARLIHQSGPRAAASFVPVDCDRTSDSVLGTELFGQMGDASGSRNRLGGAFETADRGTVFLDKIGKMSLDLQGRLLQFIETGEIQPIGPDRTPAPVDVRIIASTRNPLGERVAAKRFREQLFYRLNVVHIAVPPLRERREDLVVLFNECLRQFSAMAGTKPPELTSGACRHLTDYSWPGNVRELRNAAERLVHRCRSGRADVNDLPEEIAQHRGGSGGPGWVPPASIQNRPPEVLIENQMSFHTDVRGSFRPRDLTRDVLQQLVRLGFECAQVH